MTRERLATLGVLAIVLGLGAWGGLHMRVTSDIGAFVTDVDPALRVVSQALLKSSLTRTWIMTVEGRDLAESVASAKAVAERAKKLPEIQSVRSGLETREEDAIYRAYFPHRYGFLSEDPKETAAGLTDAGLAAAADRLKAALASDSGAFVRKLASEDPLLAFLGTVDRIRAREGGAVDMVDGTLVTADHKKAILFLTTKTSPFDSEATVRIERALDSVLAPRIADGRVAHVEMSALHRHAARAERAIRADIARVSTGSTIALVLLFIWLFRSIKHVLVVFLPMVAGLALATAVVAAVFGTVHGISLAFGAALTGVCVDYATHWLVHRGAGPATGPGSVDSARPAILLGALTTVAGVAGMGWVSFPGMRELAVFATVGVLGAVAATFYLLPPWVDALPARAPLHAWVRNTEVMFERFRARRVLIIAGLVVVCLPCFGLRHLRWVDSLEAINARDAELDHEDQHVHAAVGQHDAGRLVVAMAKTEEDALAANDIVAGVLARAEGAKEIGLPRSLHSLLWSSRLQAANLAAVRADPTLGARLDRVFAAAGFKTGSFEAFSRGLALLPPPLTHDDLVRLGLGEWVRPFRVNAEGRVAILSFLRDVHDPKALERRLARDAPGAVYFDQKQFLEKGYRAFRVRTLELLLVGVLAVFAVVWLRYRRFGLATLALVPPCLASAIVLGALGLAGVEANLFHALGVLLVLSMGADFSVFVAEHSHGSEAGVGATLVSIALACFTTAASFAFLAVSSHPAMRALGVSVALGLPLACVLSVLGFALTEHRAPA